MSPEIHPKSYGTFEKQAPGDLGIRDLSYFGIIMVFCCHNTGIKYFVLLKYWYLVYRHELQFLQFYHITSPPPNGPDNRRQIIQIKVNMTRKPFTSFLR